MPYVRARPQVRQRQRAALGAMQINPDHWLSGVLHRYWTANEQSGNGVGTQLQEIVAGADAINIGSSATPAFAVAEPLDQLGLLTNSWTHRTSNSQPTVPAPVTLFGWCKSDVTNANRIILAHISGTTNNGYRFSLHSTGRLYFTLGGKADYNTGLTYTAGTWHFAAVTWDGSSAIGYLGDVVTPPAKSSPIATSTMNGTPTRWAIGFTSSNHAADFAAGGVVQRVLSHSEIQQLWSDWKLITIESGRRAWFVPSIAGATMRSVSDTGAGADAIGGIAVALGLADTGAGSDALPGTAAAAALTDTGAGNDTIAALAAALAVAETGAGADAVSAAAAAALADSATGSDAIGAIAVGVAVQDTGAGAEGITAACALSLTDTGAGLDTVAVLQAILKTVADSGAGTDALSVAVSVQIADTGAGADLTPTIAALLALADSAGGVDAVVVYNNAAQIATIRFTLTRRSVAFTAAARATSFALAARTMTFTLTGGDSDD